MIEFLNLIIILCFSQIVIKMIFVIYITKTFTIKSKINYIMEILVI
jgi:hypothetical protein